MGRIDWEFGIDKYTLLYVKQITDKDRELCLIFCNNLNGKRIRKGYIYI